MLAENNTQAISRDIMAERMLVLRDTREYGDIVMTVHDEVISEVDENVGSLEEFLSLLSVPPDWCADVPIKVEGWRGKRYHKE
jgi:DNA polymerase